MPALPELAILAFGAGLAGFVQGISGFAFSMVALSVWAWAIEPSLAAAMAVGGGLCGQVFSAVTVRRGLHARELAPFLAGAAGGIPLGVAALPHLDPARFRLVLGIGLVVCCAGMLTARRLPSVERAGRLGDLLAGLVGGVMGGIGGITGAAPAMWSTLRGFDRDTQRAIVQNFNLIALGAAFAAMAVTGAMTVERLPALGIVVAALLGPSWFGARIYRGMDAAKFRRVVLAVVMLAGCAMIVASFRGAPA